MSRGGFDPDILRYYAEERNEDLRLRSGLSEVELIRTKEIVRRFLPEGELRILDVGGGSGVHAEWLLEERHNVHLIDPVPRHVDQATERLATTGRFTAETGDARQLTQPDASFDGDHRVMRWVRRGESPTLVGLEPPEAVLWRRSHERPSVVLGRGHSAPRGHEVREGRAQGWRVLTCGAKFGAFQYQQHAQTLPNEQTGTIIGRLSSVHRDRVELMPTRSDNWSGPSEGSAMVSGPVVRFADSYRDCVKLVATGDLPNHARQTGRW